jgi:hypothetical protein
LISGVVLNPDGSRASGAAIHAFLLGLGPVQYEEKRLFKTTANERGWFELPSLPFGPFALSAQGADSSCVTWLLPIDSEFPRFQTLRMTPTCTVSGQVIGPNGDSIPEAQVWLLQNETSRENEFKGSTRTRQDPLFFPIGEPALSDKDGRFTIPFAPRTTSRLLVSKSGFADTLSEAFSAPNDDVILTFGPRGQLAGTIVDEETGELLPGITVIALDENLIALQTAVSNHTGEFFFPHLRPAIHVLGCSDNEYTFVGERGLFVRINENERLEGIQLRVHRTVSVSGRVLNAQTGEPFPGQCVRTQWDAIDVTDENGRFHLDHVLPGQVRIGVHAGGSVAGRRSSSTAHHTILVKSGEDAKNVDISAHPVSALRGRTVDDQGQAVPYATVGIGMEGREIAVSDSDGRFAFSSVERTRMYALWAQKADLVCISERPIEIPALGDSPGVTLTLRKGATVSGHAVNARGSPLSNVQLSLETHDLSRHYTTTAADGAFLFVGVPAGEHKIEFGYLGPLANSKAIRDAEITFECTAEEDVSGIRLALPEEYFDSARFTTEGGHAIKGIVVGGDGAPIPSATIEYFETGTKDIRDKVAGVAYTLHDGTFSIENLPVGAYHIYLHGFSATYWGVGSHHKIAIPGLWPVRFTVLPGRQPGQITGLVFDKATGEPITEFEIATNGLISSNPPPNFEIGGRRLFHDEDGRFSVDNDRFGDDFDTLLHAFAEGYAPGTINLGKTSFDSDIAGNAFYLEPEGVIEGTVRATDGSPLPGASVGYVQGESSNPSEITRTRIDGRYRIGGMGHAEFTLSASHPIGIAQRKDVNTAPGKTTRVDFVIRHGETVEGHS